MLGFDCLQYAKMEGGGLHTESGQKLDGGKSWEQGYSIQLQCSCRYTDFDDIHTTPQP